MLAIKVEGIGENPTIEVEVERYHSGKVNYTTLKIGELVLEFDEKKLDEIREKIDFALWDETKEDLANKIEDLELKLERVSERLDEVASTHEEEPSYSEMQ